MKIILTKQATKYYEKSPEYLQKKFDKAFQGLLVGTGDVKPLAGEANLYRIRIGDYRAIFSVDTEKNLIIIIKIGSRGDVYKR